MALVFGVAVAQNVTVPNIRMDFGGSKNPDQVSSSLQILALLTVLSVAPAILLLTTAFTRIAIIFSFVRTAIGTQNIPPNQIILGMSLFLTFFVMGPTWKQVNQDALQPFMTKKITMEQALAKAEKPIKAFMLKNTYEKDLQLFLGIRGEKPNGPEDLNIWTLIPAFIISELKTAFIVGFYIFIPFVIIDLVVASGLMSMGMMMLPPMSVALPAKILVFILADGWHVLVTAIMSGYH